MVKLADFMEKYNSFLKYLLYSVIVTIIDIIIVWILNRYFNVDIVIANTAGVVSGFIVHYLLASKSIFNREYGVSGFIVYLVTFLIGLILADVLIYIGEYFIFLNFKADIRFILSKGISIVIPFFFLYYLRKTLYKFLDNIKTKFRI